MKLAWIPSGVAPFMTSIAIGNHHTCDCLVRNVISSHAKPCGIGPCMTSGALTSHRHLGVIPAIWLPSCSCGRMATDTVNCGRHVICNFACGNSTVVANRAIGRRSEYGVIWSSRSPTSSRFMTTLAIASYRGVNRRCAFGR